MEINTDDFEVKIKMTLKKLNRRQTLYFAWVCAVRAFPLIGAEGTFSMWKQDDVMKHLYAVLYALDISFGVSLDITTFTFSAAARSARAFAFAYDDFAPDSITIATIDVADAFTAATRGVKVFDPDFTAIVTSDDAAAFAIRAVTYASNAFAPARFETSRADAARTAATYVPARAASNTFAAAFAAVNASSYYDIDFRKILLDDLYNIKEEKSIKFNNGIYGDLWTNFQHSLVKIGCSYWGDLYADIFENNFKLDEKKLIERMDVPFEFRKQGAKVVAEYLIRLSKESEQLNENHIIILGENDAGKTCFARKIVQTEPIVSKPFDESDKNDLVLTIKAKNVFFGNNNTVNEFNFYNCNLDLQGDLIFLKEEIASSKTSQSLAETKIEVLCEIDKISDDLRKTEGINEPVDLKRSGKLSRLKQFANDLINENSKVGRLLKDLGTCSKIGKNILTLYNTIAKFIGWPELPIPF